MEIGAGEKRKESQTTEPDFLFTVKEVKKEIESKLFTLKSKYTKLFTLSVFSSPCLLANVGNWCGTSPLTDGTNKEDEHFGGRATGHIFSSRWPIIKTSGRPDDHTTWLSPWQTSKSSLQKELTTGRFFG